VGGPQFLWWSEFHPAFPFSLAPPLQHYNTSKATIISLEPCALNADFQHFIPRFSKISLLYGYPWKKGLGWKEAQRQGDFTKTKISIYTYTSQNIYIGPCKCIWQIFTLASCKCKKCLHVSVNDLHLHWILHRPKVKVPMGRRGYIGTIW